MVFYAFALQLHISKEKRPLKCFIFFQGAFKETQLNVENIPFWKPAPLLCTEMNRDIPERLLEHGAPSANEVDKSINASAVAHSSHRPAASVCAHAPKIHCLMPNGKKQGLKQLHRWSNGGYCHHRHICQHVQQLQTKGINHISSPLATRAYSTSSQKPVWGLWVLELHLFKPQMDLRRLLLWGRVYTEKLSGTAGCDWSCRAGEDFEKLVMLVQLCAPELT